MPNSKTTTHEKMVPTNGINLHCLISGSPKGDLIILLHGFPDANFCWKYQIQALAKKGYFVVAPSQRGYGLSEKPKEKHAYMLNYLVDDILGLANHFQKETFYLGAHDWGAIVAWNLLDKHPEKVKKAIILNVPHPKVLWHWINTNLEQRLRSSYAFFFRLSFLPEIICSAFGFKILLNAMSKSLNLDQIANYKNAWSQKNAMRSMLNWYRCLHLQPMTDRPFKKIKVPVMVIWGKLDPHLKWEMADDSIKLCDNGRLEYLENATHWVMEEEPEKVSNLFLDFFGKKE